MAQPMVQHVDETPPSGEFSSVLLRDLRVDTGFREGGLRPEHVERLVALRGHWPPILVGRADRLVIDGLHRVAAARELGLKSIDASFFDGGPDEALLEFISRNVNHGLPLTLGERKRAAHRVLRAHPNWSDRRIAELCAISPKTMGRIRAELCPTKSTTHLDEARIGRDNRRRPVNSALARRRVVEAIREQPDASLRRIAAIAGVSPETVRRVRTIIESPDPGAAEKCAELDESATTRPTREAAPRALGSRREFADWFGRTSISEKDWQSRVVVVAADRIEKIAKEARRRSDAWMAFAQHLEGCARKEK